MRDGTSQSQLDTTVEGRYLSVRAPEVMPLPHTLSFINPAGTDDLSSSHAVYELPEPMMKMETTWLGDTAVIAISGDIDVGTATFMRSVLVQLDASWPADQSYVAVFDLSTTGFMDTAGLGVITGFFKRVRARTRCSNEAPYRRVSDGRPLITIHNPSSRALRILKVTGLTKLFWIESGT